MSNLLGVEETPTMQPAECSWGSGDRAVNSWFLRIMNPDLDTTSLLMGEIFFKHLAQAVGYVKRSDVEEERVRLLEELSKAMQALDNTAESIGATRQQLAVLDSLEGPLAAVRDILAAFENFQEQHPEEDDEEVDEDDGDDEEPNRPKPVKSPPDDKPEPADAIEPLEPQPGPKREPAEVAELNARGSGKPADAAKQNDRVADLRHKDPNVDSVTGADKTPESTRDRKPGKPPVSKDS